MIDNKINAYIDQVIFKSILFVFNKILQYSHYFINRIETFPISLIKTCPRNADHAANKQ